MSSTLRQAVIRLAAAKPSLRAHLIPLVAKNAGYARVDPKVKAHPAVQAFLHALERHASKIEVYLEKMAEESAEEDFKSGELSFSSGLEKLDIVGTEILDNAVHHSDDASLGYDAADTILADGLAHSWKQAREMVNAIGLDWLTRFDDDVDAAYAEYIGREDERRHR